jgi:hypothetical protein
VLNNYILTLIDMSKCIRGSYLILGNKDSARTAHGDRKFRQIFEMGSVQIV